MLFEIINKHIDNLKDNVEVVCQQITDLKLVKLFWLLVALTIPFFAVSFLRIDVGFYHFAAPGLLAFIVMSIGFLMFLTFNKGLHSRMLNKGYRTLGLLTVLFLLWHILGFSRSYEIDMGFKDLMKMFTALLTFWTTIFLFPRNKEFIEKFFVIAMWSWLAMLLFLIYKYAIVFHVPYLATDLGYPDRYGKNQLATHLVVMFFYVFFFFLYAKKKMLSILPLIVLLISIVYAGSRMSWIAIAFGLIYSMNYVFRRNRTEGLKIIFKILLVSSIFLTVSIWGLSRYVNLSESATRLVSIFAPDKLSDEEAHLGRNSYSVRGLTLLHAIEGFETSPVIGVGLTNTVYFVERITHNDYVAILLELGIVGLALFLIILFVIWKKSWINKTDRNRSLSWFSLGGRGAFIGLIICSNFFNCYWTAYYWMFLGIFYVICEVEQDVGAKCEY